MCSPMEGKRALTFEEIELVLAYELKRFYILFDAVLHIVLITHLSQTGKTQNNQLLSWALNKAVHIFFGFFLIIS